MSDTRTADRFELVVYTGGVWTASPPCRALIIGTGGVITGKTDKMVKEGAADAATATLPAGLVPIAFASITEAGTTAEDITALW